MFAPVEPHLFQDFLDRRRLGSTHWTTVRACAGSDSVARLARERLCRDYWYPLYAQIKRVGHQAYDAEDLTQEFFAQILQKSWFERVDQSKGRFRSFLLASLENFLRDRRDADKAKKRSGAYQHIPLDLSADDPASTPDVLICVSTSEFYEREWAGVLVDLAWKRLEAEYRDTGKQAVFNQLKTFLANAGDLSQHKAAAQNLGMSVVNIKVSVHRLRKRYGAILLEEVARTVADVEDIPEEMRFVRQVFVEKASAVA